ncbi:MAG TPA: heme-degrading domain-containing protein [Chthoniobacterales bacterium]
MNPDNDLSLVTAQERELILPGFDEEVAWRIGLRLRSFAVERSFSVVIDVRRFEQPLFYNALPGTSPDNFDWARRKSNVVARFHRSSYAIGLKLQQKQSSLIETYALPDRDYAAHGGSFPIVVSGAGIVGSATVSGLPQRADHELVVEALCAECGKDYTKLALPPSV